MLNLFQITIDISGEAATQALPGVDRTGGQLVQFLLSATMFVSLLAVLFFLVKGAFDWLSSNGEKGKVDSARNEITTAVVGLVILASVLAVFSLLQNIFGINVLNINDTATYSTGGPTRTHGVCRAGTREYTSGQRYCSDDQRVSYTCNDDGSVSTTRCSGTATCVAGTCIEALN